MKSTVYVIAFFAAIVFLMSFTPKDTIEEKGFKNLKVLPKDISKDSLMSLMKGYNHALGVKCSYCHSQDKSADDKHTKEIARHMIQLTDDLNAKEFAPIGPEYSQAINCATCHRGSTKPMKDTELFMHSSQK